MRSSGHLCFITRHHTSLTSNTHLLDNNDKPAALCVSIHVCLCVCPLWGVKDSSPQWHGYPSRTLINTLSSLSHPPMTPPTMLPLGQMGAIIDVQLRVIGFSTLPSKKPFQNPHATSLRQIKAQTDREWLIMKQKKMKSRLNEWDKADRGYVRDVLTETETWLNRIHAKLEQTCINCLLIRTYNIKDFCITKTI